MEQEFQEYATFTVNTKDGAEVEMAVVDEFEFEGNFYVVGALIKEDVIDEEGRYIYEAVVEGEELTVKKIAKAFDYNRIAQAYMHMDVE